MRDGELHGQCLFYIIRCAESIGKIRSEDHKSTKRIRMSQSYGNLGGALVSSWILPSLMTRSKVPNVEYCY
jgi:hypothetical protein